MKALKGFLKLILFPFLFGIDLLLFPFTKRTNNFGYVSFRYLFVLTNGSVNNIHSRLISLFSKPKDKSAKGILGDLQESDIEKIVRNIEKDGFYQFNVSLEDNEIDELLEFAKTTPTQCIDVSKKGVVYLKEEVRFDEQNPISPRYQFVSSKVVQNKAVRKIIFDPSFRTIASGYLKCEAILDIVTMWWSVPFNNKATSQSAQMYHFDMDRFKFLKFFFYVKDVHTDNGPHCYIRQSHKSIPSAVRKDRRMSDEELTSYYPKENFMEFVGKKGTILAVDTRGLHKGKPLVKDSRLLFQIQFSNSLYGAPYELMPIKNPNEEEKLILSKYKRTYQLMN